MKRNPRFNRPARPRKNLPKSTVANQSTDLYLKGNLENILNSVYGAEYPAQQKPTTFRTSSLPYCPIIDLLFQTQMEEKEVVNYESSFYFAVGTVVHELIQASFTLGHSSKDWWPIGGWECTNPMCGESKTTRQGDTVHVPTRIGNLSKCPDKCPKCGNKSFTYQEAQFNYRGLTGHCDYIIYSKTLEGYIVFEFKTSSNSKVKDQRDIPVAKHHHQAQTYSFNVDNMLKKWGSKDRVVAYCLVYISRDGPWRYEGFDKKFPNWRVLPYKWTGKLRKETKSRLDLAIEGRNAVKALLKDFTKENVRKVAALKPCKSLNHYYTSGQHDPYYGDEMCPYANNKACFSTPKKIIKKLTKVIIQSER